MSLSFVIKYICTAFLSRYEYKSITYLFRGLTVFSAAFDKFGKTFERSFAVEFYSLRVKIIEMMNVISISQIERKRKYRTWFVSFLYSVIVGKLTIFTSSNSLAVASIFAMINLSLSLYFSPSWNQRFTDVTTLYTEIIIVYKWVSTERENILYRKWVRAADNGRTKVRKTQRERPSPCRRQFRGSLCQQGL